MKFSELAASFEKMEGTSSRIELTQILSSLFKNVSTAEVEKVAYLLQGRVVPFFDPTEIGNLPLVYPERKSCLLERNTSGCKLEYK